VLKRSVPASQELLAGGAIPQRLAQTTLQAAERVDICLRVTAALDLPQRDEAYSSCFGLELARTAAAVTGSGSASR